MADPACLACLLKFLQRVETFINTKSVHTWFCRRSNWKRRGDRYLFFSPVASIEVIDLYDHVILFPCEPLHSDALVCGPGHWAQNVITEQEATESDKVFTSDRTWGCCICLGFDYLSDAVMTNWRIYRPRSDRSRGDHLSTTGWIGGIDNKQLDLGEGRSSLIQIHRTCRISDNDKASRECEELILPVQNKRPTFGYGKITVSGYCSDPNQENSTLWTSVSLNST